MTESNPSPDSPLTTEQKNQIHRLMVNGGGVTYDQIAAAIGYRPRITLPGQVDALETYLLQQIAAAEVRRVWNKDQHDHFYMAID